MKENRGPERCKTSFGKRTNCEATNTLDGELSSEASEDAKSAEKNDTSKSSKKYKKRKKSKVKEPRDKYHRIVLPKLKLVYAQKRRGLSDEEIQKDSLWNEMFGYRTSTLESHHSILSKKVLDTRLDFFPTSDSNSDHSRVFKRVLLEEDWNRGRMNWMKITLRQAIMNNVDSGVVHHAVYQKQVKE